MQQAHDQPQQETAHTAYVTLQVAEREIGISRVTLRKYLNRLAIEPTSWHIGDRSLYISQDEMERVKQLKQNPSQLEHLRSLAHPAAEHTYPALASGE